MPVVALSGRSLTPTEVARVAAGEKVMIDAAARHRVTRGLEGWSDSPSVLVEKRRYLVGADEADADIVRSFVLGHCTGVGEPLPVGVVRALIACRANVLLVGASAVRPEFIEALVELLNTDCIPVVPSQGSVGAAGDLAPLAHIARVLFGFGGAVSGGVVPPPPFAPTHKEALALINGATLTTALAALAVTRTHRIVVALEAACAMTMEALRADLRCLHPTALNLRGHPGGQAVAHRLRHLLGNSALAKAGNPPDAFSIRAAPAVLGALRDALHHVEAVVGRELNGACDNPLWIDETVIEAGNFHGAPVAVVLDYLRIALVQALSQSERRTYRLATAHLTGDLPSFLVEGTGLNSGLMLAQYTAASLVSECKGLAHPASVDSIPTVQHQEDHVSMGPIAGRLTLRVLEAAADIAGIEAVFAAQALEFRSEGTRFEAGRRVDGPPVELAPEIEALRSLVRATVPRWNDDLVMEPTLRAAGMLVRAGTLGGPAGAW